MQSSDNQHEERLLIEAAQHDPSRFAELYEIHFERVYAYIARRVRERSAAEELTSHVFHQALANLSKFKWRGVPFAAWLFRIAANSIADRAQSWRANLRVSSLCRLRTMPLVLSSISNKLKSWDEFSSSWTNSPGISVM